MSEYKFPEVYIGTKFGDKGIYDNVRAAGEASQCAGNITQCITSNSSLEDISASTKRYMLSNCAALIACLAQISIHMCEKQPQSYYSVPDDCENFIDYAEELLVDVANVFELVGIVNSRGEQIEGLRYQIWDSIFTTCKIVAGLGVNDLELYITEVLN